MKEDFQIVMEEDLIIRGTVHASDEQLHRGKQPVLVICHGFKGFKDWGFFPYAAEQFSDRGFITITFNFSCNGVGADLESFSELEKFSKNTYQRELRDLKEVISLIKANQIPFADFIDESEIFLLGHSKGGATSLLFTAQHESDINGVVTWNGISNVDLFNAELREEITRDGIGYIINARTKAKMPISKEAIADVDANKDNYDLVNIVRSLSTPLHFIQGEEDVERIVEGAKTLGRSSRNGKLSWIKHAGHTFNAVHPFSGATPELDEAIEKTSTFLRSVQR
ncbi:alpha/beta hydrolase family protein [Desertibacillus haloalkaliphilus]|uniref:alpha/beta hydrolase family protein n=1 Tax=Desertibacillus haloalkaliphilus TaxID=1328930 RepID=UPI001C25A19C|nr:alpha/beta hydrolase [Desertibacillus haloalkaliphilus]MBU8907329.1 lysophospholipase [Desertibacillus haloalkaliphilus]